MIKDISCSAYILLVHDGQIALLKYGENGYGPIGGRLDDGEDFLTALRRELTEELGESTSALDEATALGSKYVFPGVGNEHRPINNIRKPFEWALSYAKLPHMRIHDLRHSFISMGANIGENIAAMKEAAGHSRITTTEGYTHIMDSSTYRAINNVANAICA